MTGQTRNRTRKKVALRSWRKVGFVTTESCSLRVWFCIELSSHLHVALLGPLAAKSFVVLAANAVASFVA
jgi:hypothetical protein